MTDTLIQNSNINEIIDITKYQLPSKSETDGSFSALFANASNKAEQTQSSFIDTAVKSNTSSINKYALDGRNTKNTQVQNKKQNNNNNNDDLNTKTQFLTKDNKTNNTNIQSDKYNKANDNQNALNSIAKETANQSKKTQKADSLSQTPVKVNQKASSYKDSSPQNTNNNSLESSPVSLDNITSDDTQNTELKAVIVNDETTVETDIQEDVKKIVENILITFDIPINTDDNNSVDVAGLFGNSDSTDGNYDFVIKAIDEISSQIDDMNLSQEDKDRIIEAFDKLKLAMQDIKENFEIQNTNVNLNTEISDKTVDETIKEAKNLINDLISKVSKNEKKVDIEKTVKVDIKDDDTKTDKTNNEIKTQPDLISKEDLKETIDKIKTFIDKNFKDDSKIAKLSNKLDEIVQKLEEFAKDEEISFDNQELIKVVKDLSENIEREDIAEVNKNLKQILSAIDSSKTVKIETVKSVENTEASENVENVKTAKTDDIQNKNISENEIENKTDLEDLKIKDKDTISEIVSKLKEFEKTQDYSELSSDDKKEIQETIAKLEKIDTKPVSDENKKIVENVKEEIDKIINTDTQKSDNDTKIVQNEQIEYKEDETVKTNNSLSQNSNNDKNDNYQKDTSKTLIQQKSDKIEYKKQENNISANTKNITEESNIDSEAEVNQNSNSANKISLIDEIKEDFFENIEYANETPVVISVSDEVVKYALNENNSLPNQMAVGNVTYDPANNAITIKNAQNLAQNSQIQDADANENNILNQIGNKLYQLKDSQKLNLVLRPNDLGRLSIELTSDKNGLTTSIVAQNEAVRSYIERNISALRTQLTEAGINVNSIQIKTAGQDGATTYDGNQDREFAQEENAQKQNQQQFQQRQNSRQKESLAHLRNYDMHFVKDFSGVLDKTLSYIQ